MCPLSKKIVSFKAELSSDSVAATGFIENLSSDNIIFVKAFPASKSLNLTPGETVNVKFQPDSGKELCLNCKVKWAFSPLHNLTQNFWLEVADPPTGYEEIFRTV
ncbi:MAG: hypothetical protein HZA10_09515 [Nitrospirae bacterium]|nr:hypothetical protein [Nitrospirota bacterium]